MTLKYEDAREALKTVSEALANQAQWDAAVRAFEGKRDALLEAGRQAVQAKIKDD